MLEWGRCAEPGLAGVSGRSTTRPSFHTPREGGGSTGLNSPMAGEYPRRGRALRQRQGGKGAQEPPESPFAADVLGRVLAATSPLPLHCGRARSASSMNPNPQHSRHRGRTRRREESVKPAVWSLSSVHGAGLKENATLMTQKGGPESLAQKMGDEAAPPR